MLSITNHIVPQLDVFKEKRFLKQLDSILRLIQEPIFQSGIFLTVFIEGKHTVIFQSEVEENFNPELYWDFKSLLQDKSKDLNLIINKENAIIPTDSSLNLTNLFPLFNENKELIGSFGLFHEIPFEHQENLDKLIPLLEHLLEFTLENNVLKKVISKRETKFQLFAANSKEVFYEINLDGFYNYVSQNWKEMLGHEPEEVIGKNFQSFVHPDDLEQCLQFLSHISDHKNEELNYRISHKEGHYVYHASRVRLLHNEEGSFYIGTCRDVSDYIEYKNQLIEQKEFYETILDNLPTDVAVFDANHKYTYLNKAAIKNEELRKFILGKDDFEYALHTHRTFEFAEERRAQFLLAKASKKTMEWESKFMKNKNEESYHVRKFTPVFDVNENLKMMVGFGVDITESKKIQLEIIKAKQFISSVIENIAVGVLVQGPKSEIIENNNAACEMLGLTQDQLLGKTSFDHDWKVFHTDGSIFKAEDHPVPRCLRDEISIRGIVMGVYRPSKKDIAWLLVDAIPVFNPSNVIDYVICSFIDITELKNVENNLKLSNDLFKGAFDYSAIGMAIVSPEGYWKQVNNRICEIFGYTREELEKLTFVDLTHPDDLEEDLLNKERLVSGEISNFIMEKRYIRKNNAYVWTLISVSVIRNDKNEVVQFVAQIIDINERKRIEEENKRLIEENNKNRLNQLKEAKNLYRLLADNIEDLVCLHHLDGTFQYVSPSIKKLLGYTPEELIGKSPKYFIHPEDAKDIKQHYLNLMSSESNVLYELRFKNAAGKYIWVEVNASKLKQDAVDVSIQSSTRDITQRKKAEESINQALLKEKELSALRTNLVSTISHEFRTPMTTIRTSTELIDMYLNVFTSENDVKLKKQLNTITNEIDRITELMNAVLIISKNDSGKTTFNASTFDLKELCLNVIETSFSNYKDQRKVKTHFIGSSFVFYGDKSLMEYTLFNLLNNAFKYSEGSGDVFLQLENNTSHEYVIKIKDNGIGIPNEDQPNLFNTFFRASNTNGIQGTGLGLYIVKMFTERNSGSIKLKSKLNKGTEVILNFPIPKN